MPIGYVPLFSKVFEACGRQEDWAQGQKKVRQALTIRFAHFGKRGLYATFGFFPEGGNDRLRWQEKYSRNLCRKPEPFAVTTRVRITLSFGQLRVCTKKVRSWSITSA